MQALNAPQVSKLNKEAPQFLAAGIAQLLEFINKLFNLPENKKLNDAQIALLATDIRTRYWFLKFDELVYILREGVAGKWGKSYSRLDTEVIHAWFQTYITTERDAVIEQVSYNEAVAYKKQEAAPVTDAKPMPDHIRQQLSELRHKLEQEAQPEQKGTNAAGLTQETVLEQLKEALPEFTPFELKGWLKQAELSQNKEIQQLIETELATRNKAA